MKTKKLRVTLISDYKNINKTGSYTYDLNLSDEEYELVKFPRKNRDYNIDERLCEVSKILKEKKFFFTGEHTFESECICEDTMVVIYHEDDDSHVIWDYYRGWLY